MCVYLSVNAENAFLETFSRDYYLKTCIGPNVAYLLTVMYILYAVLRFLSQFSRINVMMMNAVKLCTVLVFDSALVFIF